MNSFQRLSSLALLLLTLLGSLPMAHSAPLGWDPDGNPATADGGTGNWTTTGTDLFWNNGSLVANVPWTDITGVDIAVFGGTAGTVTIDTVADTGVTANGLTFNVTGYIINGATAAEVITLAGTTPAINVATLGDVATINAIVSGSTLNKTGNGTLTLTGANNYVGATTVTAGVLNIQNATGLGTTTAGTTVASGAALELQGGIAIGAETLGLTGTLRNIAGDNTYGGVITINAGSSFDVAATTTLIVSASAIGSGAWTKTGNGTLRFTADPNQTGALTITGGVVELNHGGATDFNTTIESGTTLRAITAAVGDSADITVNTGGTYDWRVSDTMGGLAGDGLVTKGVAGAGTLTVNNNNETTAFSGVIENGLGTVSLTKNGTGTLTLTGINTYTGSTTVTNGIVTINGATGSIANSATVTVGDNSGGGETLNIGAVGDSWASGTLNRLSDAANVILRSASSPTTGGLFYNGPTNGNAITNVETIGTLTFNEGRNAVTLVPGTGNEVQLTTGTLVRGATFGTGLIRGTNLGGTGAGSTRLVVTTTTGLFSGAGGADGATNKSIIRFLIGDTSVTGAGTGFLTDGANGLRLLTVGEYDTTITGNRSGRNVTTAGGETISVDTFINALRLTGGTTTISAGKRLNLSSTSGANTLLFTNAATIGGAGTIDFGTTEGIIMLARNTSVVTAGITAQIAGTAGLTFGRSGDVVSIFELGGNNTVIGQFTVNQGTVQLTSTTALNDNFPMTVILRPGTALDLNGNNITLRDLQSGGGGGVFRNGSATTAATLTSYLTGDRSLAAGTPLQNGAAAALNVVVSGGFTLTIDQDTSATGSYEQRIGTTVLSGASGTLNDFTSYAINGGTIRLSNTNTANNTNRLNTAPITFNAGTLDFSNNAGDASFTETVGVVTLNSGANTITVDKAIVNASNRASALTLASLIRNPGATLNLTSQNNNVAIFDLGTTGRSQLIITSQATASAFLGGGITVDSSATTREFAKYVLDTDGVVVGNQPSVTALTGSDYTSTLTAGLNPSQNVKITAGTTLAAATPTQINSLILNQAGGSTIDLGGNTMRVQSGGIIVSGDFNASFINGTLTAGTMDDAAAELFIHTIGAVANPVTIDAIIANNGTGAVSLVKTGTGRLDLDGVTNTYTGSTYLNGGTTRISADTNLGTATAGNVLSLSNSSTLDVTTSMTLNSNRAILVGAGSNIISIASGTAGNGQILTYTGSINGIGTTEGSLQFRSNPVATTGVDPGRFNATLSALNVGGNLRLDAGAVTVTAATSTIGRSLQIGTDGVGSITYTSAGGSLTVGQGINDALDIGIVNSDIAPSNTILSTGTLNVSALSNFTANTATIRLGIGGGTNRFARGIFQGATNNDLTAGTSILVSNAGGPSQVGQVSSLAFGGGTNNVTTPLFTLGGLKGEALLTIASGGTLNLGGFAANTQTLYIARNNGNTGTVNNAFFNGTNGTVNGSFNQLVIAEKTGGGAGGATGVLTLTGAGNSISTNTLSIANVTGDNLATTAATTGTLNFGGGTFVVNNDVAMATYSTNTVGTPTSTGRLNITGGTFTVAGNITRTTDNETRSNSFINVDGGILDLQNQTAEDATQGTITASQLAFRSGSITDVASATLQATSSTNSGVAGTVGDALILRDTTATFAVNLTGATAGNVHYESAGGGAGGTLSGNVDLGTIVRTFNVEDSAGAAADLTVSGVISNTGGIDKTGAGRLVLSNATNSSYATTTVTAGTLQVGVGGVGTTGTGITTVATTGTLAGTGTVKGTAVTHAINGILRPGDDGGSLVGNLKFEGNLAFGSTASLFFQLGAPTTPGTTYDRITGLTAATTLTLDGTINAADVGTDNFFGGYAPSFGDTWMLFDWTNSLAGIGTTFNVGTNFRTGADGVAEGDLDLPTLTGFVWDVSNFATNGTIMVVPEPSRALLFIAGLTAALLRRRRPFKRTIRE